MKVIFSYERLLSKKNLTKLIPLFLIILITITTATVFVIKRKTIIVVIDGKKTAFVTYKSNVGDALKAEHINIDKKDKINPSKEESISEGTVITVKKAVGVKVFVDGKTLDIKSAENSIASMLKKEKIAISKNDTVSPALKASLKNGQKILITRVKSEKQVSYIKLGYKTIIKTNYSLPNTIKKTINEGKQGEKKIITEVVYHNGKIVSKKIISQVITKNPINKLIVKGGYMKHPVAVNGKTMAYVKKFKARATAYWAIRGVGRTYTGSGRLAIRNPNGYSTVAVDKHILPYGTKLFIEGYGFAIAADSGSSIIGNKIDVYFNTRREACSWGVKYPTVYVLK